ncbi:hypothetical protein T492DRAFT_969266 [Pavlovales sp. CCMP2436]|nr:hypothetical protein T492DRAFT_969266 [Pavlovales sp. CCMP2436]
MRTSRASMAAVIAMLGLALLPAATQAILTPRADALVLRRGRGSLEEAANLYSKALEQHAGDVELKLKLADALNGVMRVRTNGNSIAIDRMLDNAENKAIWAKYGPRALELAREVRDALPKDVRAAHVFADAYMFSSSSKGIITQALQGAATVFVTNAELILALDEKYDSGVGHALLGCFYAVAPWPFGSLDTSSKQLEMAVKIAPTQRNLYFSGVVAFKRKEWEKAAERFRGAQVAKPGSLTESDFSDFMLDESTKALTLVEAELKTCAAKGTRR